MYQRRHRRNVSTMWALVVVALIYVAGLTSGVARSVAPPLYGGAGIVLGLFICSRPASNLVDIVLFGRTVPWQTSSRRDDIIWLVLNVVVMLAGCVVLFAGAVRLAGTNG